MALDHEPASHDFVGRELCSILYASWTNLLLLFLPFALASGSLHWHSSIVFTTNFCALIPLAFLLSYSTRQLSKALGHTLGGLLTITFGNFIELVVGVVALLDGQVKLIQNAMLGSILSSYLFVRPLQLALK